MEVDSEDPYYQSSYIGSILSGASKYLPSSLQSLITPTNDRLLGPGLESITSVHIEHVNGPGLDKTYLLLVYEVGFQVWDVSDVDNMKEVVSRRDPFRCKFIRMLRDPDTIEGPRSRLDGLRPLLALCPSHVLSVDENASTLKFYSLKSDR